MAHLRRGLVLVAAIAGAVGLVCGSGGAALATPGGGGEPVECGDLSCPELLDGDYHLVGLGHRLSAAPPGELLARAKRGTMAFTLVSPPTAASWGWDHDAALTLGAAPAVASMVSAYAAGPEPFVALSWGAVEVFDLPGLVSASGNTLAIRAGSDDPPDAERTALIAVAAGTGLDVGALDGSYNVMGLDTSVRAAGGSLAVVAATAWGSIDFDGSGGIASGLVVLAEAILTLAPVPARSTTLSSFDLTGDSYAVAPDGALSITSSSASLAGAVNAGDELFVLSRVDDGSTELRRGLLLGVREGSGMVTGDLEGTFQLIAIQARQGIESEPIFSSALAGLVLHFDGTGDVLGPASVDTAELGLVSPWLVGQVDPVFPPGGTYHVFSDGGVGMTVPGYGDLDGFVSPDGDTLVLSQTASETFVDTRMWFVGFKKTDPTEPPIDPTGSDVIGPGIGFPFEGIDGLAEIRAYAIPDWDDQGPHNGIDIIVNNDGAAAGGFEVGDQVPVISPAEGEVVVITEAFGDPGDIAIMIEISPWAVASLTLEAQTSDEELIEAQRDAIKVGLGEYVALGDPLGFLVVGEGEGLSPHGSANPHAHLSVVFKEPWMDVEKLLGLVMTLGSGFVAYDDVSTLPSFLCPYAYSTPDAQDAYDVILAASDPALTCTCACVTPYNHSSCGVGCFSGP